MSGQAAARMQRSRDKRRAAGLVKVESWVHVDDRDRLCAYVKRINKQRGTS